MFQAWQVLKLQVRLDRIRVGNGTCPTDIASMEFFQMASNAIRKCYLKQLARSAMYCCSQPCCLPKPHTAAVCDHGRACSDTPCYKTCMQTLNSIAELWWWHNVTAIASDLPTQRYFCMTPYDIKVDVVSHKRSKMVILYSFAMLVFSSKVAAKQVQSTV